MDMLKRKLRSCFESKLNMVGAPMRCSIDAGEDHDDLGSAFPMLLSNEISLCCGDHLFECGFMQNLDLEAHASFDRKALGWPRTVLEALVEECARKALKEACPPLSAESMEEWEHVPSTWDVPKLREYLSEEEADPCIRYPAGSIVLICDGCGAINHLASKESRVIPTSSID